MIAPVMAQLTAEWMAIGDWHITVVPVANDWFGHTVTVSGLLTGRDVITCLAQVDVGEVAFLPRVMFDTEGRVTLDDLTQDAIATALGVRIEIAGSMSQVARALS
jgi:NifB/MoaA-like Fe-S oxidoreductase